MGKKKIVVYTIQSKERYKELLEKKVIFGSKPRHVKEYWHGGFLFAYKWMSEQMGIKTLPLFAWIKKPDFRSYKKPDKKYVMLTLEIDSYRISDFQKWHCVLGKCYLPHNFDSTEESRIEKMLSNKYKYPMSNFHIMEEKDKKMIKNSWKRIFKIKNEETLVQVCFQCIKLENVKEVTFF